MRLRVRSLFYCVIVIFVVTTVAVVVLSGEGQRGVVARDELQLGVLSKRPLGGGTVRGPVLCPAAHAERADADAERDRSSGESSIQTSARGALLTHTPPVKAAASRSVLSHFAHMRASRGRGGEVQDIPQQ